MRIDAKKNKNYAQADQIREALNALDIELKDTSDGAVWTKK
jgi:cysteinyl-tRNA synthetase